MTAGIEAVAVAVPARNEAARVQRCVAALDRAASAVTVPVFLVVSADRCSDATAARTTDALSHCRSLIGSVLAVDCGTAGGARQAASVAAVSRAQDHARSLDRIWLATSDSDSAVDDDWLVKQLAWAGAGFDGVTGLVRLEGAVDAHTRLHYERYVRSVGCDVGHSHVHGANLGVRAEWWARVGGFASIPSGEDHALWTALRNAGATLMGVTDLGVTTSGRLRGRAPDGLARLLSVIAAVDPPTVLSTPRLSVQTAAGDPPGEGLPPSLGRRP